MKKEEQQSQHQKSDKEIMMQMILDSVKEGRLTTDDAGRLINSILSGEVGEARTDVTAKLDSDVGSKDNDERASAISTRPKLIEAEQSSLPKKSENALKSIEPEAEDKVSLESFAKELSKIYPFEEAYRRVVSMHQLWGLPAALKEAGVIASEFEYQDWLRQATMSLSGLEKLKKSISEGVGWEFVLDPGEIKTSQLFDTLHGTVMYGIGEQKALIDSLRRVDLTDEKNREYLDKIEKWHQNPDIGRRFSDQDSLHDMYTRSRSLEYGHPSIAFVLKNINSDSEPGFFRKPTPEGRYAYNNAQYGLDNFGIDLLVRTLFRGADFADVRKGLVYFKMAMDRGAARYGFSDWSKDNKQKKLDEIYDSHDKARYKKLTDKLLNKLIFMNKDNLRAWRDCFPEPMCFPSNLCHSDRGVSYLKVAFQAESSSGIVFSEAGVRRVLITNHNLLEREYSLAPIPAIM